MSATKDKIIEMQNAVREHTERIYAEACINNSAHLRVILKLVCSVEIMCDDKSYNVFLIDDGLKEGKVILEANGIDWRLTVKKLMEA